MEYEKRLSSTLRFEWVFAKTEEGLERLVLACPFLFGCLDSKGTQYTSSQFSLELIRLLTQGGSRLAWVIGGSEGIPKSLLEKARCTISFSKMTFTHQMARLILVEQIYRALEIAKNSKYNK